MEDKKQIILECKLALYGALLFNPPGELSNEDLDLSIALSKNTQIKEYLEQQAKDQKK